MMRARLARRLGALVVLVTAFIACTALPASAHAVLDSTTPEAGADLPAGQPPSSVTLNYSESVQVRDSSVRLFNGGGKQLDVSDVRHGDRDSIVTANLADDLDDGTYVVAWSVVSADSHPIDGAFTFVVGKPSAVSAIDLANKILSESGAKQSTSVVFAIDRFLNFLAVLLLVGIVFFVRTSWREFASDDRTRRFTRVAALVACVTSVLAIMLESAYTASRGIDGMFDVDLIRDTLDTSFGRAWALRALLALLAFFLLRVLEPPPSTGARVVEAGLGLGLLVTITWGGHATTGPHVPIAIVADLAHVIGAAMWLGGIAALVLALCRPAVPAGSIDAARRFSKLAAPAIAVIIISGFVQAWRQVEHWSALWDTTYGRLVIAKVILVGCILVAASASRDLLRRRLVPAHAEQRELVSAGPGAAVAEADPIGRMRLRNAILVEAVFAVIVIAVTSVLVNVAPAREALASKPYAEVIRTEGLWFDTQVTPNRPGPNDLHLIITQPAGAVADTLEASAELSNPKKNIPPIEIALRRLGPGHYTASGFQIPFAGEWHLKMTALLTETDQVTAETNFEVR